MCGFCCYFHFDSKEEVFPSLDLDTSLEYIHHRGPDAREVYVSPNKRCGLGFARLSIIDLEGGKQPMSNSSGNIHTVVNGELYEHERIRGELQNQGHKFQTKSDSEIALHLYEEYDLSFLDRLRGEFALSIYDAKKSRFIAARDRFGIKPLYYTVVDGTLLTASEIKAFIPMGWKPEWDIDSIINNGVMCDYRTCFKGVYKLPPASYLIATSSGSIEVQQYWDADYPDKNTKETRGIDEMIQGVHDRMVDSVKERLIADVPVGVYLSGGIDSSCIAGIASKLLKEKDPNAKLRAFSISFKDSEKLNESDIAKRTAEFCDVEYNQLTLTEKELLENFEESIWYYEQPQFNLNCVGKFLLSEFVRDEGIKVVLTGEGADEHFGGYGFFHGDYLREADHASPKGFGTLPDKQREAALDKFNKNPAFKEYFEKIFDDGPDDLDHGEKMLNNTNTHVMVSGAISAKPDWYTQAAIEQCGDPNPSLAMAEAISGIARIKAGTKWHPLHTAMYVENHTLLPNYLCNALGDRSEMSHSIEARTCFLDHPLCEYVNGLPPSVKVKMESDGSLNEKWILKEAVKPYITEEIYTRTKQAFIAPASKGCSEQVASMLNRVITTENLDNLGWVNTEKFIKAKDNYLKDGDAAMFKEMIMMISFITLSQRFNVATWNNTTVCR